MKKMFKQIIIICICVFRAWDANKLPSGNFYGSWYQLSNFAQCMNPPWLQTHPQFRTQYCLAEVQMTPKELKKKEFDPYGSAEVFLKTKTKIGLPVNRFTWGICVSASCQPTSIVKLVRNMYLGTHFRAILKPNITVDGCQVASMKEEYSTGFYLFLWKDRVDDQDAPENKLKCKAT